MYTSIEVKSYTRLWNVSNVSIHLNSHHIEVEMENSNRALCAMILYILPCYLDKTQSPFNQRILYKQKQEQGSQTGGFSGVESKVHIHGVYYLMLCGKCTLYYFDKFEYICICRFIRHRIFSLLLHSAIISQQDNYML